MRKFFLNLYQVIFKEMKFLRFKHDFKNISTQFPSAEFTLSPDLCSIQFLR